MYRELIGERDDSQVSARQTLERIQVSSHDLLTFFGSFLSFRRGAE